MRHGIGALLLLLVLALAGATRAALILAQPVQGVTYVGTILDSIGAPPPAGASIQLAVLNPPGVVSPPRFCGSGNVDLAGNYQISVLTFFSTPCQLPGTALQLLVNNVPAQQNVVLPSSPGTYVVNFTLGVALGGRPYTPPVPAAHVTVLNAGCSQVVLSLGAGATPAQVAADVANPSALAGIWHFDNPTQRFTGYFSQPGVPSDLLSLAPVDTVFVCVSAPTSIAAP